MKRIGFIIIALLLTCILAGSVGGVDVNEQKKEKRRKSVFGMKAVYLSSGVLRIDGERQDMNWSYGAGFYVHYLGWRNILPGFSAEIKRISLPIPSKTITHMVREEMFMEVCFNLKYNFSTRRRQIAFRPGISIGYGLMQEIEVLKTSRHLIGKLYQGIAFLGEKSEIEADIGLFWFISGSDNTRKVTSDPIFFLQLSFGAK